MAGVHRRAAARTISLPSTGAPDESRVWFQRQPEFLPRIGGDLNCHTRPRQHRNRYSAARAYVDQNDWPVLQSRNNERCLAPIPAAPGSVEGAVGIAILSEQLPTEFCCRLECSLKARVHLTIGAGEHDHQIVLQTKFLDEKSL